MKPGELPVKAELAKVGLQIVEQDSAGNEKCSVIIERPDITPAQRKLLEGWLHVRRMGKRAAGLLRERLDARH